jgi:serine/threonine-protein kinase
MVSVCWVYKLLTNQSPFRGDSVYATITKRLKSDPVAPSVIRVDCSAALDAIILRAMHRDPEQRFQSANDILHALQNIANSI